MLSFFFFLKRSDLSPTKMCFCVSVVQCICGCVCFFCLKLFNIFSRKIRCHLVFLPQVRAISFFPYGLVFFSYFLGSVFKSFTSLGLIFLRRVALWNVLLWVRSSYLSFLLPFSYITKHFWTFLVSKNQWIIIPGEKNLTFDVQQSMIK